MSDICFYNNVTRTWKICIYLKGKNEFFPNMKIGQKP